MTRRRRWLIAAGTALVLALTASGWQGWIHWSSRHPEPDLVLPVNRQAAVGGATFRIDDVRTGRTLPAESPDDPPVRAPAGAMLMLVIMTTEVTDPSVKLSEQICEMTVIDDQQRVWRTESDISYALRRPEALSCRGSSDHPIQRGRPLQVGFSFVVPAEVADQLDIRLEVGSVDSYLINFTR